MHIEHAGTLNTLLILWVDIRRKLMNDSNLDNKASLKQKLIVTSMATAMGITVAPVSFAQEATGIEEIIVTARQRAESSQDVPMTITALSGEDIERQGITTLEDFSRFVSNLNVTITLLLLNRKKSFGRNH